MPDDAYESRIVAFADILGWTKATNNLSQFGCLRETATSIKAYACKFSPDVRGVLNTAPGISSNMIAVHSSIEFTFFSDSFSVSAPVDNWRSIFSILSWANDILLRKEFAVRGGVTIGDLYHKKGIIFGPALVEAVKLERQATYPRFICSDKLVSYLDDSGNKQGVILHDCNDWIVNTACGGLHARDDLMGIVEKQLQLHTSECIIEKKWRYIQTMMPKMYDAKG